MLNLKNNKKRLLSALLSAMVFSAFIVAAISASVGFLNFEGEKSAYGTSVVIARLSYLKSRSSDVEFISSQTPDLSETSDQDLQGDEVDTSPFFTKEDEYYQRSRYSEIGWVYWIAAGAVGAAIITVICRLIDKRMK